MSRWGRILCRNARLSTCGPGATCQWVCRYDRGSVPGPLSLEHTVCLLCSAACGVHCASDHLDAHEPTTLVGVDRIPRIQALNQDNEKGVHPRTVTCSVTLDSASLLRRASALSCVTRLRTPPPYSRGL
jgi:hypothetical protein